jgi:signal peptide peptidase SppA
MAAALPEIAARLFNTPLCVDAGKAAAIVTALGERILAAPKVVVVGAEAVNHAAFQNGRPSAGRLGDRTGRALDQRRLEAFDRIGPVAVIPIEGSLVAKGAFVGASSGRTSYEGLASQIARAGKDSTVRGIVFEVDSYGGEVAGLFDLAEMIRELSSTKPTLAILTDHALSAAYALASAARQIVMPEHGSAGSIGAVALHADFTRQLDKEGVRVTVLRSGARKAEGSPFEALSKEAADAIQTDLDRIRDTFAGTVARNRGSRFNKRQALLTEGAAFDGRDALAMRMVDAVGNPSEAFDLFVRSMGR